MGHLHHPEIATFGAHAAQLEANGTDFVTLEYDFRKDDRATTDDCQYGKSFLYLSKPNLLGSQKILSGAMIAPHAGELILELILAT